VKSVQQIVLDEYRSRVTTYTVKVSNDGKTWSKAHRGSKAASQTDTRTVITLPKAISARYVKLVCNTAVDKPTFWEIEVLGRRAAVLPAGAHHGAGRDAVAATSSSSALATSASLCGRTRRATS
jgi:hypothetical protein